MSELDLKLGFEQQPAGEHHVGVRCGYSMMPLHVGDQLAVCRRCSAIHLLEGWRENCGCSTLGCSNAPDFRKDTLRVQFGGGQASTSVAPSGDAKSAQPPWPPYPWQYRQLEGLTRTTHWFLVACIVMCAVSVISHLMQISLMSSRHFSLNEAEANDTRQSAVACFFGLAILGTVVTICMWIVRAHRNVRLLGAVGLPISPGWAAGWFFVPIAHLFKPFQAMRDLVKASTSPASWSTTPSTPLLGWWWTMWIAYNLLSQCSSRLLQSNLRPTDVIVASTVAIFAELALIIASSLLIKVVWRVSRLQSHWVCQNERLASPTNS